MSIYSVLNSTTYATTNSTTTSTDTKTATETAAAEAEQQKIEFLNLLLTQLSNQNPLDPMNTDEFAAQLTRYSILEQGIETNEKLAVTNDLLEQSTLSSSFSYIGKEVELETRSGVIQDGEVSWTYSIDGSPSDVYLTVTDADGNSLGEFDGSILSGANTFTLDTSNSGLAEGTPLYLYVNAKDSDGESLDNTITASVTVDGVWSDGDTTYLTAGQLSFKADNVLKIADGSVGTVASLDDTSSDSSSDDTSADDTNETNSEES